jgi:PAS domain S-box-containing protein
VLVLSGGPGHSVSIDLMESTLRGRLPWPVKFSAVNDLEDPPFDKEPYREGLAEALRQGFGREKPDLVIAVMDPSLRFALQYRDKMFPDVPIIFMSISSPELVNREMHGVIGVASSVGVRETIDLALRLHPDSKAIAVITNISPTQNDYLAAVHSELLRYQDKVREIDVVGPPNSELLARVTALPPHTVVLVQLLPHSSDKSEVYEVVAAIAQRRPTYCIFPGLCLNYGGVGGSYDNATKDAVSAGELAARVLSGERPDKIPRVYNSDLQVTADWRQLRRWHIKQSALPLGSVVLYREPTLWERGRKYFLAGIALIVGQALLIFGLFWQRARKRKTEAVLRESEQRFRLMADTMPSLIWMCDEQGKIIYLNERRLAFTNPDPGAGYGDTWTAYHPDDVKHVMAALSWALKSRTAISKEYRLLRHDGVYRWMLDVASPRVNGDGSFAGFIGSAIDITDQKLAQEALEKVGGRLLEAQEEERRRIARELHDDISQRLALLLIELSHADDGVNGSSEATKERLKNIPEHCSSIAHDVQSLSHHLHNSKLDYLGIVAAIGGFCKEFSGQYRVNTEFKEKNVPTRLPKNVSVCLFRVAQEALHNAVKYSGTREYTVELSATANEVHLVVADAGAGFDLDKMKTSPGMGLVSMQERMRMVQGRFTVESRPGEGTKVVVSAPLTTEDTSSAARSAPSASVPGAA